MDLPTVGLETLKDCKKAGLKGIVLKSMENIILDKSKCLNFANKNKIFIHLINWAGAKNYKEYSKNILKICKNKPVSLEVFADNPNEMEKQAYKINSWGRNVFVKIPIVNSKGKFMGKLIKKLNKKKIK